MEQERLPLFLKLAERLQVAGLTQKQGQQENVGQKEKRPAINNQASPQSAKKSIQKPKVPVPKIVYPGENDIDSHDRNSDTVDESEVMMVKSEAAEAGDYQMTYYDDYQDSHGGEGAYYEPNPVDHRYNAGGGEEFPCHLCGKTYKTAGSLKNHRSLYHRDQTNKYQGSRAHSMTPNKQIQASCLPTLNDSH